MTGWVVLALATGLAVGLVLMFASESAIKYGPAVFLPILFGGMCAGILAAKLWVPALSTAYLGGFTIALAIYAGRGFWRNRRRYDDD